MYVKECKQRNQIMEDEAKNQNRLIYSYLYPIFSKLRKHIRAIWEQYLKRAAADCSMIYQYKQFL